MVQKRGMIILYKNICKFECTYGVVAKFALLAPQCDVMSITIQDKYLCDL